MDNMTTNNRSNISYFSKSSMSLIYSYLSLKVNNSKEDIQSFPVVPAVLLLLLNSLIGSLSFGLEYNTSAVVLYNSDWFLFTYDSLWGKIFGEFFLSLGLIGLFCLCYNYILSLADVPVTLSYVFKVISLSLIVSIFRIIFMVAIKLITMAIVSLSIQIIILQFLYGINYVSVLFFALWQIHIIIKSTNYIIDDNLVDHRKNILFSFILAVIITPILVIIIMVGYRRNIPK